MLSTISAPPEFRFWIPMAQNDRALPLFDFCCSNLESSDWLKRKLNFARWEGRGALVPPTSAQLCRTPLSSGLTMGGGQVIWNRIDYRMIFLMITNPGNVVFFVATAFRWSATQKTSHFEHLQKNLY